MNNYKLGELLTIKHGFPFKGEFFAQSGKYIILTPANFYEEGGFKYTTGKEKFYQGKFPEEYICKKDELIVAMTQQAEGLLGSTALVPEDDIYLHNQRIGLITVNDKIADKNYVNYLFRTQSVRKQIRDTASGSKVKHTSPEKMYEVEVNIPKIGIQKKIGNLLKTLDEKIQNNNKINAELEAMAKTLYDYWFLQFEFPNEEGKPYKSSGGKMVWSEELNREIPEGWKVELLGNILSPVPCTKKYKVTEYLSKGEYPIIDQSKEYICGYTNQISDLLHIKDCIIFGDHTKEVKYVNFPFARGADGTQIIKSNNKRLRQIGRAHV